jgi:ech hydrogenase subunit F
MAVMLPTVLRNVLDGPATRLYPFKTREPFENARGHVVFNDDKCILCSVCATRCPADAITINKESKTLSFEPARCIVCEVCVLGCPSDAITLMSKWRTPFARKPVEVHEARGKKPRTPM